MTEVVKQNYRNLIGVIEDVFQSDEYASKISDMKTSVMPYIKTGDITSASAIYQIKVRELLIPYLNTFDIPKNEIKVTEDFEIIDEAIDLEKTGFMQPLDVEPVHTFDETMYHIPVEEVKQSADNVFEVEDNKELDSTTIIPINKDEVETLDTKENKVLLKKKAGYIDTVILCLVAQLGIFGLLIVILLVIK